MKTSRLLALALALPLLAVSLLLAQPKDKPKKLALLVGVNNYEGTGLGSLNHTVRDMEALEKKLKETGFEVELLPNTKATKENIEAALKRMKQRRAAGDLVLIGMSGHGVQTRNSKGEEDAFFCPSGCDKSEIDSLVSLTAMVQSLGSKGVNLILVDACRDDPRKGFRGIQGNELQDRLPANTAILFSCSAGQQSFETNRMFGNSSDIGHGVFFYQVLQGLGGAAKDADNEVTWDTLVNYVKKSVDARAKEWFDDRAKSMARDRGIEVSDLRMQTPHALSNLQDTPVLSAPKPAVTAEYDLTGGYRFVHFGKDQTRVVLTYFELERDSRFARVYDAGSGRPLTPPMRHDHSVRFAAFSPDGSRVVTTSDDETARVWDSTTGRPLSPPLEHGHLVEYAAFSPDGSKVVTASGDRTARVWDAKTGQPLSPPLKHEFDGEVHYAAFSPDGSLVVTGSRDRTARVWDAKTGQPKFPPLKHDAMLNRAAFSPDGSLVITASDDKTARVWDAKTGQPKFPPLKHGNRVRHVAFSRDGSHFVTASDDYSARIWDSRTGAQLSPLLKHEHTVGDAAFSPDGSKVVTASQDQTARVWDVKTGQPVSPTLKHDKPVWNAAFSLDGSQVVTLLYREARVWDAKTGTLLKTITITKD